MFIVTCLDMWYRPFSMIDDLLKPHNKPTILCQLIRAIISYNNNNNITAESCYDVLFTL